MECGQMEGGQNPSIQLLRHEVQETHSAAGKEKEAASGGERYDCRGGAGTHSPTIHIQRRLACINQGSKIG